MGGFGHEMPAPIQFQFRAPLSLAFFRDKPCILRVSIRAREGGNHEGGYSYFAVSCPMTGAGAGHAELSRRCGMSRRLYHLLFELEFKWPGTICEPSRRSGTAHPMMMSLYI